MPSNTSSEKHADDKVHVGIYVSCETRDLWKLIAKFTGSTITDLITNAISDVHADTIAALTKNKE